MTALTAFLIGWGSLNAFIVVVSLAATHRRGASVRRASRSGAAAADRMRWTQRHEWQ